MPKPDNGRRKKADAQEDGGQPLTVTYPRELYNRAKQFKTALEIEARGRVQWIEILGPALEDYLKKKGA